MVVVAVAVVVMGGGGRVVIMRPWPVVVMVGDWWWWWRWRWCPTILPLLPEKPLTKFPPASCCFVEDGQDDFRWPALQLWLAYALVFLFPCVPPEQSDSGRASWSWPLDEAKLPRRKVQV